MATNDGGQAPRAVIHKRILDSAETDPDASLQALAAEIPGASPDLVERVLDEYGDPGEAPGETTAEPPAMSEPEAQPTDAELSDQQRETLAAIAERPEATQSDLAQALGVSRATVNKRLADIEGFDWGDRRAFVETVLGDAGFTRSPAADTPATEQPTVAGDVEEGATDPDAPRAEAAVDGGHLLDADDVAAVEQLQERVARLERQLDEGSAERPPAIEDTELLAKVLRAVLADEGLSEAEELRAIESLL